MPDDWPKEKKDWIKRHDDESNLPYDDPEEKKEDKKPKDKK